MQCLDPQLASSMRDRMNSFAVASLSMPAQGYVLWRQGKQEVAHFLSLNAIRLDSFVGESDLQSPLRGKSRDKTATSAKSQKQENKARKLPSSPQNSWWSAPGSACNSVALPGPPCPLEGGHRCVECICRADGSDLSARGLT